MECGFIIFDEDGGLQGLDSVALRLVGEREQWRSEPSAARFRAAVRELCGKPVDADDEELGAALAKGWQARREFLGCGDGFKDDLSWEAFSWSAQAADGSAFLRDGARGATP